MNIDRMQTPELLSLDKFNVDEEEPISCWIRKYVRGERTNRAWLFVLRGCTSWTRVAESVSIMQAV